MYDIDRIVTIIKPKQAMFDWLLKQPEIEQDLTLEELRKDCTALLIPICEDEEQATQFIASIFENIFANELATWNPDESSWPEHRTFEMFLEWFELEFHSLVFDLVPDEDFEEDDENSATLQ